jgi:ATP-dependent exoDNAse (exonuclease V) beta subunit
LIDHLIVTPDEYRILDYKMNQITAEEVATKADYYHPQMKAYAAALADDPDRTVRAALYFGVPGVAREFTWSREELASLPAALNSEIRSEIDSVEL